VFLKANATVSTPHTVSKQMQQSAHHTQFQTTSLLLLYHTVHKDSI
jgi:hypothetical protein